MRPCFVSPLIVKAAKKIGARCIIEPDYRYAGQITFANGRRHYFKDACLDVNPAGAAEIARDKAYSAFFLSQMGYPAIPGRVFFSPYWQGTIRSDKGINAACDYAAALSYPVIVKPNDLSQGIAVSKVHNQRELRASIRAMPPRSRSYLVQRVMPGADYRLVVFGGALICAYQRSPLSITGNGTSTIGELLAAMQQQLETQGYETAINPQDPRILTKLKRQRLSYDSIPKKDACIALLDNANLSSGGSAVDITAQLHPSTAKLAVRIAHDMGLTLCGVDIMTTDDISRPLKDYCIVEINASPGLDHYARLGTKQKKTVEQLYHAIVATLAKRKD
jgi:D-alanine-D-alanine ligase-like ATP-grasp enzyme